LVIKSNQRNRISWLGFVEWPAIYHLMRASTTEGSHQNFIRLHASRQSPLLCSPDLSGIPKVRFMLAINRLYVSR
jgi:hypothetical protein